MKSNANLIIKEDELPSSQFYKLFYFYLLIFSIVGMIETVPISYALFSTFAIHLAFSYLYSYFISGENKSVSINHRIKRIYQAIVLVSFLGMLLPYQISFTLINFEFISFKQESFNTDNLIFSSIVNIFFVGIIVVVSKKYTSIDFEFDHTQKEMKIELQNFLLNKKMRMIISGTKSIEIFMDPEYSTSENIDFIYLTDKDNHLLQIPFGSRSTGNSAFIFIQRLSDFINQIGIKEDIPIKVNLPDGLRVLNLFYKFDIKSTIKVSDIEVLSKNEISIGNEEEEIQNMARTSDIIKYLTISIIGLILLYLIVISTIINIKSIENLQLIFTIVTFPLFLYLISEIIKNTIQLKFGRIFIYESPESIIIVKRALFLESKDIEIPKNIINKLHNNENVIKISIPYCDFEFIKIK